MTRARAERAISERRERRKITVPVYGLGEMTHATVEVLRERRGFVVHSEVGCRNPKFAGYTVTHEKSGLSTGGTFRKRGEAFAYMELMAREYDGTLDKDKLLAQVNGRAKRKPSPADLIDAAKREYAERVRKRRVHCDDCNLTFLQAGVLRGLAHERGCPNEGKRWDEKRRDWVRFVECFDCGCEVEAGQECCGRIRE